MKRAGGRFKGGGSALRVAVPKETKTIQNYVTASGTFQDGDIMLNKEGIRVCSQTQTSSTPSANGNISLPDLETVKVLGKGAGGVVQLVRHKWTNETYALKVIHMNIEDTTRKQIVQELKINHASQSAYVVICYDAFYANGLISIVLEYMDGGSLADIMKELDSKCIKEPNLAVVSKQVLEGLRYLHQTRHIIHRDIKPSNLLINHKGEVKISDFGVSAVLANSMAVRDTFVGTCTYMSPERVRGHTYGFDSDIWSLGLTLLECALGKYPYQPSGSQEGWMNFYELLQTIVDQPPPAAPEDHFSPEFCSFISACLQKDPKNRPSAAELLNHPFLTKYDEKEYGLDKLLPPLQPLV